MSDASDLVTLEEAKSFLNIPDDVTDDDTELGGFISGITRPVENLVGVVVQRSVTDILYPSSGLTIPLPRWPVVSLTSGVLLRNGGPVDVSNMVADRSVLWMKNYAIFPVEPWALTYLAGQVADTASVPQNIKYGALEVLKLAWATQRGADAPAFLVSYRAEAWLSPDELLLGFA